MGNGVALAEKLQQEILKLPQEALPELEKYIEFLRFKVGSSAKTQKRSRSARQSTCTPIVQLPHTRSIAAK